MNDYTIVKTRLKSGHVAVRPMPDGSGYKTRAHRLAEHFGRWVHRWKGYTMSSKRAAEFEKLYAEGWDASTIMSELRPPREVI